MIELRHLPHKPHNPKPLPTEQLVTIDRSFAAINRLTNRLSQAISELGLLQVRALVVDQERDAV